MSPFGSKKSGRVYSTRSGKVRMGLRAAPSAHPGRRNKYTERLGIGKTMRGSVCFFTVNILLSHVEARVLGALLEKESTTPEYYPLSLNALVNACNQKSNRDPMMHLEEEAVRQALRSLSDQGLARSAGLDSRVTKYEHRLREIYNFTRPESAILCELLLRGPQTPGELRSRAERMHPFDDLGVVQSTLQRLMQREPALVKLLARQPGTKEARYGNLLGGDEEAGEPAKTTRVPRSDLSTESDRVGQLEREVARLRKDVEELKKQFTQLQK
jgi:uncharacterized protein